MMNGPVFNIPLDKKFPDRPMSPFFREKSFYIHRHSDGHFTYCSWQSWPFWKEFEREG